MDFLPLRNKPGASILRHTVVHMQYNCDTWYKKNHYRNFRLLVIRPPLPALLSDMNSFHPARILIDVNEPSSLSGRAG
ncbi:hypothetical protein RSAG8_02085, partial [Rhizoctonia solani AG-8 WAC10335]